MAKRKKSGYKDFATNQKLMYVALMLLICFLMAILLVTSAVHFNREHEEKELKQIIGKYAENGGIIYGADDSAPPLRFIDSDNVYKGIVVDYINQLALEMGTEIEAVPYTWENALQALEKKEINICDMFANEERAEKFSFTDPIYILRTIIVTPLYKNYQLSDINRLTVATQKGDYANTYMRKNYPGAELIYVHDIGDGLKLLKQGKVDAVIGDEPVVSYYADLLKMDDNIHPISAFLYEEPVVLAVNKEQQDLIKPLNSAISAIKKKGQLEAIQQKWFGISTPLIEKKDYRIYLNYFIVASFLAVVFIIFRLRENMKLKKEVAKRTIELEKSHNELRLIFNEMPEGVLFLSKDKLIMNCNNPARKTLNIADGETLPVKCSRYMTPLCGSCKDCIIDRCTETGEVRFKKSKLQQKNL